ncbi:hypothetical protein Trco_007491 [Trichoderma cornu-damae]|uniref:Uncharacterized protein n=1 Tax=Trichoderma cornu-damae TaxID=654480 RepID=A0A9P8QFU1_9HYPO|nr:hypothetical protein Trco_007491 [Trichoderma cornu-damae]
MRFEDPTDVAARAEAQGDDGEKGARPYDFVILMGHSVGAYISVEIFHRHMKDASRAPHLHLRHGFLAVPNPHAHCKLPAAEGGSPSCEASLAWRTMRTAWQDVTALVRLKSRDGVWQAIHLGLSELRTICEEKWEEELWEATAEDGEPRGGPDAARQQKQTPKFFIFYGKHDHWVANHLRDAFIARRSERGHTRIQIDEGDIPHAFCVKRA